MSTLLDKLGKNVPEISKETKSLIGDLQELTNSGLPIDISKVETTDTAFKSFLKTWDGTGDIASKYNDYMQSASTATSKFGAAIKSAAINMTIMLVISEVVSALYELSQVADEVAQKAASLNKNTL